MNKQIVFYNIVDPEELIVGKMDTEKHQQEICEKNKEEFTKKSIEEFVSSLGLQKTIYVAYDGTDIKVVPYSIYQFEDKYIVFYSKNEDEQIHKEFLGFIKEYLEKKFNFIVKTNRDMLTDGVGLPSRYIMKDNQIMIWH